MTRYDIKWMYEINEPCWTYCGEKQGGVHVTSSGRVVGNFNHDHHLETFFIIKLDDPNAPYFIVRDALQMSPSPDTSPAWVPSKPTMDGGRWPDETIGLVPGVPVFKSPHLAPEQGEMEAEIELDDEGDEDDNDGT